MLSTSEEILSFQWGSDCEEFQDKQDCRPNSSHRHPCNRIAGKAFFELVVCESKVKTGKRYHGNIVVNRFLQSFLITYKEYGKKSAFRTVSASLLL